MSEFHLAQCLLRQMSTSKWCCWVISVCSACWWCAYTANDRTGSVADRCRAFSAAPLCASSKKCFKNVVRDNYLSFRAAVHWIIWATPSAGTVEQAKKVCYCARKRQTLCEPLYRSRISKSAEKDHFLSANRPDPTVIRSERGMNWRNSSSQSEWISRRRVAIPRFDEDEKRSPFISQPTRSYFGPSTVIRLERRMNWRNSPSTERVAEWNRRTIANHCEGRNQTIRWRCD